MSVKIGTDSQSRSTFCDEDGNPLESMPVATLNMINISGWGAQVDGGDSRPASRRRISMEDDHKSDVSGESSVSSIYDPAAALLEESRMKSYREYRNKSH